MLAAEEAIYQNPADPLVNWDERDLLAAAAAAGLEATAGLEFEPVEMRISAAQIEQWFAPRSAGRPSYGQHLAALLSPGEIDQVASLYRRKLSEQVVVWKSPLAMVIARRKND